MAAGTARRSDVFIQVGRDGGTGKHVHSDFRSAYKSVSAEDKRRAFYLLGAAGVTLAVVLLSRLLWLFEPMFDKVGYGLVSELIYYGLLGAIYTAYVIALTYFVRRTCNIRLFRVRKRTIGIARAMGVIAVAAVAVLIVSGILGFKLKMQNEMGLGVTATTALTNVAVYIYYALHLWLGFVAAAMVQYACSILIPAKYTVPWGGIFLVAVFGLLEFLFEATTTAHLFPGFYLLFTYAYAGIFVLTGRSFHVSYWASVIVLIL